MDSQSDKATIYCTFCGKSQHEVEVLICSPFAMICEECSDFCSTVVAEHRAKKAGRAALNQEDGRDG